MKKILAISNQGYMLGGGEYSFYDLFTRLSGLFDIRVIVPQEGELAQKFRQSGLETKSAALSSLKPLHGWSILKSLAKYITICREHKPNLIYANGSRPAFYGGIIGRILHIPVLWHCRVNVPDRYLDPLLTRLCRRIVANSRATAARFPKRSASKIQIVYNGIDLDWLQIRQTTRPAFMQANWKSMLLVARVSKMKKHDLAIAAFETCAARHVDYHLFCIGDPDPFDPDWSRSLKERTAHSPVADRIHWINQVEDLRPWYQHADLALLPSEQESFGRVLVEAMACGKPVVAAKTGGMSEIVRHGQDGFLFKPGHAGELAHVLTMLMENQSLRQALGFSAKNRAEDFGLDHHVRQMEQIFRQVMNEY